MKNKHLHITVKNLSLIICLVLLLQSCKEDVSKEETGLPPVAAFSASINEADTNQLIQFADESTNNPTSWQWSVGEGPDRALQNPSIAYSVPGWYTISLTVTNSFGTDKKMVVNYIKVGQLDSVKDYEGNAYLTVKIGKQWWMAENLKSTKYNDGTSIPQVTDSLAWAALTTPAYCWYDNDPSYKNIYGALYNWYAVNTGKLAPAGWHIPSDAEWKELEMTLGMTPAEADADGFRGTNQGTQMKKRSGWPPYTNGTNTSGFSAVPGGCRLPDGTLGRGSFVWLSFHASWWTSTLEPAYKWPWYRSVSSNTDKGEGIVCRDFYPKTAGFSIRCVKDE